MTGLVGYILVYPFVQLRNIGFLETFEHELSHALVSLLLFRRFDEFLVKRDDECPDIMSGHVKTMGKIKAPILSSLAPYYLSVFTIPFLFAKLITFEQLHYAIDCILGATMAFHYVALLKEFRGYQTDISQHGWIFSLLFTTLMNILLLVLVLAVVLDDLQLFIDFAFNATINAIPLYMAFWQEFQSQDFEELIRTIDF